jgi:predicted Zn-dependent protease
LGTADCIRAEEQGFRNRASASTSVSAAAIASDVEAEVGFGKDVAARILGRYRLFNHAELTKYVNLVGQAVAAHSDRPELTFYFAILDTESVNAYAAPGGYVFITRGALMKMQDEAELAAVLAHEVAHVSRKHVVKELKIQGTEKSAQAGLAHLLGGTSDPARVAFAQAVDKAVVLLFDSGLKREDELEADRLGTLILANTGYDATALRSYVARMKTQSGEIMKMMHATHPAFDQRLALLDELIAKEQLSNPSAPRAEKRFHSRVN